jgi:hypothetical protein
MQEFGPATIIDTAAGRGINGHITTWATNRTTTSPFMPRWTMCRATWTKRSHWAEKQ